MANQEDSRDPLSHPRPDDWVALAFKRFLVRYRASFPGGAQDAFRLEVLWRNDLSRHPWITEHLFLTAEAELYDTHTSGFIFQFAEVLTICQRLAKEELMRQRGEETARIMREATQKRQQRALPGGN